MDNQGYYIHNGALSYELDQEHTDYQLTDSEMRQIAKSLNGVQTAVHLCCGAGRHVAAFENLGITSIGIDISPDLLRRGWERMREGFTPKPCLVQGDVLLSPLRDRSTDCATLLGNSLCLFPKQQCGQILSEVKRILIPGGIFILDLPDPAYLGKQRDSAKKTSQTIRTKTHGEIEWTWIRHADPKKRLLISEEFVHLKNGFEGNCQTRKLRFEFHLYEPEQACSMSENYGMRIERTFECEDVSSSYKGMLRKRSFLVLRSVNE